MGPIMREAKNPPLREEERQRSAALRFSAFGGGGACDGLRGGDWLEKLGLGIEIDGGVFFCVWTGNREEERTGARGASALDGEREKERVACAVTVPCRRGCRYRSPVVQRWFVCKTLHIGSDCLRWDRVSECLESWPGVNMEIGCLWTAREAMPGAEDVGANKTPLAVGAQYK
jgi:hypothetical protein